MILIHGSIDQAYRRCALRSSNAAGIWVALLLQLVATRSFAAEPLDQTHARYARVLSAVVKDARVDYSKLKSNPVELDAYLQELAAVPALAFSQWSEAERLALLLNLYNAQTLRLIAQHYPVKSIRSIGVLPGAAWRELTVRFGGQILSLDHLEHKIIRVEYREPRIHFALVCAALGCPPLRAEPFVGSRLDQQLEDQARQFLAMKEKNRFDGAKNTLYLSPLFQWYDEDFTKAAGSLARYVKPLLPEAQRNTLSDPDKVIIKFTEYDWALNVQTKK